MVAHEEEKNLFHRVSYICAGCGTKRDVFIDSSIHQKRNELKSSGLVPYIDIHSSKNNNKEHAVKIFVDINFQVRSNNLMSKKKKEIKGSGLLRLPSPKIEANVVKIMYESRSWNSFKVTSASHNISFFLINPNPSSDPRDKTIVELNSAFETVEVHISFQYSKLKEEFVDFCKNWFEMLIKWIELTASLNHDMVCRLLYYIDYYNMRSPTTNDELILSILLDSSAEIKLNHHDDLLENIPLSNEKLSDILNKKSKMVNSILGINTNAYKIIIDIIKMNRFTRIDTIVKLLAKNKTLKDEYIDSLIIILFDLFRKDAIEYKVSYLL